MTFFVWKNLWGVLMFKRKLYRLAFFAFHFMLLSMGCDMAQEQWNNLTSSGSGSNSSSGSKANNNTSQEVPAHGPVAVNLLERSPFKGMELDSTFWANMEAYCKAGPTQLIIADMNLVPVQMSKAGFDARWTAQCYALATTYAGLPWEPDPKDGEVIALWNARDQVNAWWSRYIQKINQVMQNAPQTTAIIIHNDGFDRLGFRLGDSTLRNLGSVQNRVSLGGVIRY